MIIAFIFSISLSLCLSDIANAVSQGTVRLYRNGVADTSQSWSSGIVQIYYSSQWGNICDDVSFRDDEADVICHQLGYTGASSYSNTGTTSTWGTDSSLMLLDDVSCLGPSYLAITQCAFSTYISISTCDSSRDVIVSCYSTRIWASPSTGDIRLTGGTYSNQGLLEVYCNGQWGTVCDDFFYATQAQVACNQLGYNYYTDYNHLSQQGSSSQEIFLRYLSGCTSSDACLIQCGGCPSSGVGSICSHNDDVTLECLYSTSYSKIYTKTIDTCDYYDSDNSISSGTLVGAVVGGIIICIVCTALCIGIPICICACFGVGIGAAIRSGSQPRVSSYKPQHNDETDTAAIIQPSSYYPTADASASAGYPPTTQQPPPGYYTPDEGTAGYPPVPQQQPAMAGFPQELQSTAADDEVKSPSD